MSPRPLPHVDPNVERGLGFRAYCWLAGTRIMGRVSQAIAWKTDPILNRLSGGRVSFAAFLPTGLLETRGARTGEPRANVVIYFHDGERVTLVASKMGLPENPSWYHNLRANPDVRFGGWRFHAEVITDEASRARLFELADRVFPAYRTYRRRAGRAGRTVPIVQLKPV